jgi:WD repeat-containing protein 7
MKLVQTTRGGKTQKYLLRGDSEGFINMWAVPDFTLEDIKKLQTSNAMTQGEFWFDGGVWGVL